LKDPAKAATIRKLKIRLAHLADLDAIGPTEVWLRGVPPGKISHFAGEAKVTDAADMVKVGEDKRLTLLAAFVHVLRTSARDEVTDMFCKHGSDPQEGPGPAGGAAQGAPRGERTADGGVRRRPGRRPGGRRARQYGV
jgi:hypothetical protein